jgi:thiosulfate/3-mercaptopyruvate sulfurtransferase
MDSRESKRYLGLEEPIDKKAGHIPGAINKPWMEGISGGRYKQVEEQRQRFSDIDPNKEIIVYCGSGVTATPNYLALKEAGFEKVKLYVGSFSDWISYPNNKIE